MSRRFCEVRSSSAPGRFPFRVLPLVTVISILATSALSQRQDNLAVLTFRVGASVGRDGDCAELYEQTARGYQFFFEWLERRYSEAQQPSVTDASGREFTIRFKFRLVSHNCTDAGRAAALSSLLDGGTNAAASIPSSGSPSGSTWPDSGPGGGFGGGGGSNDDGPVHLLLGGNGINAQDDALQANNASRLLLHCCTARDSVYLLDLPYVYGLFTPASMYTGAILRAMAFTGLRRVAVAYTVDSKLHVQLCGGALRQMIPLAELRPGFGSVVTLNYTEASSLAPGYWDQAAAAIAAASADTLVVCDELQHSAELVKALRRRGHWLSAMWLASYGNISDLVSYLGDAGKYALTTVQWMPNLPYADPFFGTAAEFAGEFTAATGLEASYFSAAAAASGYVLLTAIQRTIAQCDLSGLHDVNADAFMWQDGALSCGSGSGSGSSSGSSSATYSASGTSGLVYTNASGQLMLRNVLSTLQMDTFFGPVGFNHYRQNVFHPPVVAQVLDNRLAVVVPLEVADQRLVLPIPGPTPPPGTTSWASSAVGIAVITLLCCLGCLSLVLLLTAGRRWVRTRINLEMEVEIDPSEVKVDVPPTRNVDGSFEPGEGMYKGTRVKLVVATELLAQLPPPAQPQSASLTFTGMLGRKSPPPQQQPSQATSLLGMTPAVATSARGDGTGKGPPESEGELANVDDVLRNNNLTIRVCARDVTSSGAAATTATGGRRTLETSPGIQPPTPNWDPFAMSMTGVPSGRVPPLPAVGQQFSKRSRKQLSVLVWRAMRLQHPSICPVLGIAWEWPGLLEGDGTVPVVVRQWYELGDLAQLIDNSTVPLPLLTKTGIVQGIAEGLAYLHAQEPPIIAGPLEVSRIVIDKHFNPHIFLRLVNLDPAYSGSLAASTAAAAASMAAAAAAATPATNGRGGGAAAAPLGRMVNGLATRSRGAETNSPSRTPRANGAAASHQVVLIDAALNDLAPDVRCSYERSQSAGSRTLPDPWAGASTTTLMAAAAMGEPYIRSKAQDVLEFGRLLGMVFLGSAWQGRISDSTGLKDLKELHGISEAAIRPDPTVPVTVNNFTGGAINNGATTCVSPLGEDGSTLRKQMTAGSDMCTAPIGTDFDRQSSWLDEQQHQQHAPMQQGSPLLPQPPQPHLLQPPLQGTLSQQLGRYQSQQQQQQHLLRLRQQQQDALMLQALDEVCPEIGELARACLHPHPLERPSFAAIVAVLESRVRLALSGGLGFVGISRACVGIPTAMSVEASRPIGTGSAAAAAAAAAASVGCAGGTEGASDAGRLPTNSLVVARTTGTAAGGATARRSCSFQLGPTGQQGDKAAMRRHLIAPDDLLFDLFPPKVAHALCAGETVQPERYECVSIFFSDVVGYTDLCGQLQPHEVMDLMHRLYSLFDDLIRELRLFKVETVGDAYLAVGNLRWPQPETHARLVAQFAFDAVRAANSLPVHPERPELGTVRIRVGLHCGPVVGSVVGTLNRRYCLFGDAVNTAARMEHNSEADRVHCSSAFASLVSRQWPELRLVSRGVRQIKGKGPMETFWVEQDPDLDPDQDQDQEPAEEGGGGETGRNSGGPDRAGCTAPLPVKHISIRRAALDA